MTHYQKSKSQLKEYAKELKSQHKNDKALIRTALNDYADSICRNGELSEYQQNLLHNYVCKLHPKSN